MLAELGFASLRHVDKRGGYDDLKAALERLAYRLPGGLAAAYPELGDMRRHVHLIRSKYIPGIASRLGQAEAVAYVAEICRDKWSWDRPWASLSDDAARGPERIRHLLYTLAARLSAMGGPADPPLPGSVPSSQAAPLDKPLISTPPVAPAGQIPPTSGADGAHAS